MRLKKINSIFLNHLGLLFCSLLFTSILQAQNPVFRHFPEKDLPFKKIYSSIIDKEGFMLLGTNEGVFKFDGSEFEQLKQSFKEEILLLTKTADGQVFAKGINRTIHKVADDSLRLLHKYGPAITQSIEFVKYKNSLIISSLGNKFLRFNLETNLLDTLIIPNSETSVNVKLTDPLYVDKNLLYYRSIGRDWNVLISFDLETLEISELKYGLDDRSFLQIINFKNEKYLAMGSNEPKKDSVFQIENNTIIPISLNFENDSIRIDRFRIEAFEDKLTFMSYSGIEIFESDLKKSTKLLKGKITTGAFFDGNFLWVSTLNNGLFFYPNFRSVLIKAQEEDQIGSSFNQITSFKEEIFVSSINGKIFQFDNNKLTKINSNDSKFEMNPIFKLHHKDTLQYSFIGKTYSIFKNEKKFQVEDKYLVQANKDISFLGEFILASSHNRVSFLGKVEDLEKMKFFFPDSLNKKVKVSKTESGFFSSLLLSEERSSRNLIHPKDSSIWYTTEKNIIKITRNSYDILNYNGKVIIPKDLKLSEDNEVWFSDSRRLFTYREGVQKVLELPTNQRINNFSIQGEIALLSTNLGVTQFNFKNKQLKQYTNADGLPDEEITAAIIQDSLLYVTTKTVIVKIPIMNKKASTFNLKLRFKNIQFNKQKVSQDSLQDISLKYNDNDLVLTIASLDLQNLDQLVYNYKLEGIDKEWISTQSFEPIRYSNLIPGRYNFCAYGEDFKNNKSEEICFQFTIDPPFWKTWWFISSVVLLIGFISVFTLQLRLKRINQKRDLNRKLIQSEIDGLKSQMNPHFIFNSLNSIQDLTLSKDYKNSTVYLGKFSSLLRMILNFSSKNLINIEDEVELLNTYLELENLRFDRLLDINVEMQGIKINNCMIPPLLIQPYVENALKHGLFQSAKKHKKLTVLFFEEPNRVGCFIEDNGIGRKASQKINERREKYHDSYATKAIEKRIDLINETLDNKIEVKIIDLEEGTRVELYFPKS